MPVDLGLRWGSCLGPQFDFSEFFGAGFCSIDSWPHGQCTPQAVNKESVLKYAECVLLIGSVGTSSEA